jgi:hypothetical protein
MISVLAFTYLPNVVLTALLAAILWKAGLRGLWLTSALGPVVAGPVGLWLLTIPFEGRWAGVAFRIVLPFLIKWVALFILAFKGWPRARTDLQRVEIPS